jgi:predicted phage terminase large subunit-like protein
MTPKQLKLMQERVLAEKCRRDLLLFAQKVVWPVVEGANREFKMNWHLSAICEHLTALKNNEIRNLIINIPPRFMKSLLVSVSFPTWVWLDSPESQFISASYSKDLSTRDAVKSRRVIESPFYQTHYGDLFQLSGDQNVKTKYENDKNGHRIATSVGGLGTGEGGDYLMADDPHNVLDGESDKVREETCQWWSEVMPTRINNPKTGHKLIIMQRVHARDLSGLVLEQGGYEHLFVPMRYEEERVCVTVLGRVDPREKENELAWENRFDEQDVAALEKAMGSYAVAGQFQQRPAPRGGALIDVSKIHVVSALPAGLQLVRGWDLAATEEKVGSNPAYTASVLMGRDSLGRIFICDVLRKRFGPLEVETALTDTAKRDGKKVRISFPQDPGAAGKIVAANYTAKLAGWIVKATPETGDKLQRAEPFAAQVEAGNVYMLKAEWNKDYIDELKDFPASAFKDQVDATSRAFAELIELPTGAENILEYYRQLAAKMKADNPQLAANDGRPGSNILQFASIQRSA